MKDQILKGTIVKKATWDAFRKLDPRAQIKNPVMFVTLVGALITTGLLVLGTMRGQFSGFDLQITLYLS